MMKERKKEMKKKCRSFWLVWKKRGWPPFDPKQGSFPWRESQRGPFHSNQWFSLCLCFYFMHDFFFFFVYRFLFFLSFDCFVYPPSMLINYILFFIFFRDKWVASFVVKWRETKKRITTKSDKHDTYVPAKGTGKAIYSFTCIIMLNSCCNIDTVYYLSNYQKKNNVHFKCTLGCDFFFFLQIDPHNVFFFFLFRHIKVLFFAKCWLNK